jgi:hypothetical protein
MIELVRLQALKDTDGLTFLNQVRNQSKELIGETKLKLEIVLVVLF